MPRASQQQGFSLLEVLVALLVITVGLIGLLATQARVQQQAFNNYQLSIAGLYAQDIQDRLRIQQCYLRAQFAENGAIKVAEISDAILVAWQAAHPNTQQWNMQPSLELANNDQADQVEKDGYFAFSFTMRFPDSRTPTIEQRLLVAYTASNCSA